MGQNFPALLGEVVGKFFRRKDTERAEKKYTSIRLRVTQALSILKSSAFRREF
jgi:hypothetical protein